MAWWFLVKCRGNFTFFLLQHYMVSHPRRHGLESSFLWKPQILQLVKLYL